MKTKKSLEGESLGKIDTRYLIIESDMETDEFLEFDVRDIFMNYITSIYVPKSEINSYFLTNEEKDKFIEVLDSMGRSEEVLNHLENLDCYKKITNIDQFEDVMFEQYGIESNLRKLNNGLFELVD